MQSQAEPNYSIALVASFRIDRLVAVDSRRKIALLAWYLAAGRLVSEPDITILPSFAETNHLHARPRLRTLVSKTGN